LFPKIQALLSLASNPYSSSSLTGTSGQNFASSTDYQTAAAAYGYATAAGAYVSPYYSNPAVAAAAVAANGYSASSYAASTVATPSDASALGLLDGTSAFPKPEAKKGDWINILWLKILSNFIDFSSEK